MFQTILLNDFFHIFIFSIHQFQKNSIYRCYKTVLATGQLQILVLWKTFIIKQSSIFFCQDADDCILRSSEVLGLMQCSIFFLLSDSNKKFHLAFVESFYRLHILSVFTFGWKANTKLWLIRYVFCLKIDRCLWSFQNQNRQQTVYLLYI